MKIYDISMVIEEDMVVYPDNPKPRIETRHTIPEHGVHDTVLKLGTHTGTHVDAPKHFVFNGKSIDQVPLRALVGSCRVLDLTNIRESISRKNLEGRDVDKGDIVLLKTLNSYDELTDFNKKFIYLEDDGADFLIEKEVKSVGIDYLSIERADTDEYALHKKLFSKDIPIIEGLRLGAIKDGRYILCCLPLKVKDAEAAPARAILIETTYSMQLKYMMNFLKSAKIMYLKKMLRGTMS